MLAYIFWHWPIEQSALAGYEAAMLAFHRALSEMRVPGLLGSWTFRVGSLPWLPAERARFEDWYLVEDFAALGPLNELAVAGAARAPHDTAARAAASGAGALYRLVRGEARVPETLAASWITKGKQRSYEDLYAMLDPLISPGQGSLWRRQMVLGPAPEFCLLSEQLFQVPGGFEAVQARRQPVGR